MLISAGAEINVCDERGVTPLLVATLRGHVAAVKMLLRNKASALLPFYAADKDGHWWIPLDVATDRGDVDIVGELVQHAGIMGCGGPSGGTSALVHASTQGQLGIVTILLDAGVVDSGDALRSATKAGQSKSVQLLLEKREGDIKLYVSSEKVGDETRTTLFHCFHPQALAPSSCRVMKLLLEARADTTINTMVNYQDGAHIMISDLVQYADYLINRGMIETAEDDEKLCGLKGLRRLLVQKEAVTASSWLWPSK